MLVSDAFQELERLAELNWLSVTVLNKHPLHVRIVGQVTVDWWPSTGRAWVYGTRSKSREMTVKEIVELATGDGNRGLDEEFRRIFE